MFSGYQPIGQGSSLGASAPMPASGMSSMGAGPAFQSSSLGASEPRPQHYQSRYQTSIFTPAPTFVATRPQPVREVECCPIRCVIL